MGNRCWLIGRCVKYYYMPTTLCTYLSPDVLTRLTGLAGRLESDTPSSSNPPLPPPQLGDPSYGCLGGTLLELLSARLDEALSRRHAAGLQV